MRQKWLEWAIELQALAQAGLTYGKDIYDRERYTRIREIAAEKVAHQAEMPFEKYKICFAMKPVIKRPNSILGPPFFRGIKFFWCRRPTEPGRCPAAGWK